MLVGTQGRNKWNQALEIKTRHKTWAGGRNRDFTKDI
jgi:hypothetical protein